MHTPNPFFVKFASSIIAVLGCHDRILFKGHLPFSDEAHLNRFVDDTLRIKRKDFLAFAAEKSELLVAHAKDFAARHGAPYVYLQGHHRKEKLGTLLRTSEPLATCVESVPDGHEKATATDDVAEWFKVKFREPVLEDAGAEPDIEQEVAALLAALES
jgi:hypothetical protein